MISSMAKVSSLAMLFNTYLVVATFDCYSLGQLSEIDPLNRVF